MRLINLILPQWRQEDKVIHNNKFKKGAASFYIVAFSTLILLVVATSFAAIIISEITRTSNDDLSQSAYDSAMAGVEDAKLAFYNYQNCKASPGSNSDSDCGRIISLVDSPKAGEECQMVGSILGRTTEIQEYKVVNTNTVSNNMQQEYTCAMIKTKTRAIESNLNAVNSMRVYDLKFADVEGGLTGEEITNQITQIKVSWFSDENLNDEGNKTNFKNFASNKVVFKSIVDDGRAVPPTIAVAVVQTSNTFNLSDFERIEGNKTDRGMVYLVPTIGVKNPTTGSNFKTTGANNEVGVDALSESNNKQATNLPYTVNCSSAVASGGYACSATINIPRPVGNNVRNPNTFMVAVSLPYGTPSTDFALEFKCGNAVCAKDDGMGNALEGDDTHQATLDGVQIVIDSTGRANDLYRRVEVRLEEQSGSSFLSIMGPLELLGGSSDGADLLNKDYTVKCEYNFGSPTC